MAVRPRTLNDARNTYGTNYELAWWVFMRVSGVILVFLVFGHLWVNNIANDVGLVDYDYVVQRITQPWVKVYDTFLLFFSFLHGMNGLRYSIEDYIRNPRRRFMVKAFVYTLASILFIMGTMTLWAFSYSEMGDAIRALPMDH